MSFLTPLFLLLALLALPIILMYMLRLRRRDVVVSSTLLWQKLLRDREANAPWQRLRRNLLLILQLFILALLVLALARPFLPVPSIISGNAVVLLDGSASMQATDVQPSRFEAAREQVRRLISELDGGDQMTLILVGRSPRVLVSASSDRAQLRAALDAAQPENGGADWAGAVALAAGAAQGFRDARIAVVSDGGLPDDLPPVPAEVVYLPIGASGENLSIAALATRSDGHEGQLFASVRNHGQLPQNVLLNLELDGELFDARQIEVPAGGEASTTWPLPPGATGIHSYLSGNDEDVLPLDDSAWTVHEGGVSNRILLVTPGNLFLEQVFRALPGVQLFQAVPDAEPGGLTGEAFDLVVFDSVPLSDPLPAADLLLVNPLADGGTSPVDSEAQEAGQAEGLPLQLAVSGTFTNTTVIRVADDPLLQYVEWSNVHIREAKGVSAPWARPLVSAAGGPLLLAGQQEGRRVAILTFRLQDSDLPLQIAFPILMANLTNWLNPGQAVDATASLQAGDVVPIIPGASTTSVLIEKPDGEVWTAVVEGGPILFPETEQTGLYHIHLRDPSGTQSAGSFAVNLFTPLESGILPAESIPLGQESTAPQDQTSIGQRELWPWLALLALLVLALEWWVYHRGLDLSPLRRLWERVLVR